MILNFTKISTFLRFPQKMLPNTYAKIFLYSSTFGNKQHFFIMMTLY